VVTLDTERARVAHLLRRAGFGASEAELDEYTSLGFGGALDRLLNPEQVDDSAADAQLAPLALDTADPESRKKIEAAKFWWFNRMLQTRRPLQEKMTLFWHTHFRSVYAGVLRDHLGADAVKVLGGSFDPVALVTAAA
jgi:uncharacterized protein (DUF1800 family)